MRIVMTVGIALAMLVTPAAAQMGGNRHKAPDDKATARKGPQIDEKAYQEALKQIPEPTGPVDPWGAVRPADKPKPKSK